VVVGERRREGDGAGDLVPATPTVVLTVRVVVPVLLRCCCGVVVVESVPPSASGVGAAGEECGGKDGRVLDAVTESRSSGYVCIGAALEVTRRTREMGSGHRESRGPVAARRSTGQSEPGFLADSVLQPDDLLGLPLKAAAAHQKVLDPGRSMDAGCRAGRTMAARSFAVSVRRDAILRLARALSWRRGSAGGRTTSGGRP